MNHKALLLSITTFVVCISFPSMTHAIPSNLRVADEKSSIATGFVNRVEIVQQFIQAVEAKDVNTINQLLEDNVVLEQPYSPRQPGGTRFEGRQAVNAFLDRIFGQFSQVRFVDAMYRQSESDNTVIFEARGDFQAAADQSPYRNQYVGIFEVVDGRVVSIREYFNPLLLPETSQ